jgi:hypothetical protein
MSKKKDDTNNEVCIAFKQRSLSDDGLKYFCLCLMCMRLSHSEIVYLQPCTHPKTKDRTGKVKHINGRCECCDAKVKFMARELEKIDKKPFKCSCFQSIESQIAQRDKMKELITAELNYPTPKSSDWMHRVSWTAAKQYNVSMQVDKIFNDKYEFVRLRISDKKKMIEFLEKRPNEEYKLGFWKRTQWLCRGMCCCLFWNCCWKCACCQASYSEPNNHWYCSELVARALREGGLYVEPDNPQELMYQIERLGRHYNLEYDSTPFEGMVVQQKQAPVHQTMDTEMASLIPSYDQTKARAAVKFQTAGFGR